MTFLEQPWCCIASDSLSAVAAGVLTLATWALIARWRRP